MNDILVFIERLKDFVTSLALYVRNNKIVPAVINPINQDPPPPAPTGSASQYDFSNPIAARHSVRMICDEEGLPLKPTFAVDGILHTLKDILCACIEWESGFNNAIIHPNKNGYGVVTSTDYGICQINDFWHIGLAKDFPSKEYVLSHPTECVRWMARQFKAGRQTMWVSFTSGEYKRFI